ncbi:MAG TPA: RNA 2',3'-cyclic phosphodiesterase [Vicinamibacteria bacterium]|nr:RNA 2',3'-cyclic phosphodiesterase [Vicinamibacteria bacterium]
MDVRAFVALELDTAARERLRAAKEDLRRELAAVRWVRPEGIHLTLRFLGQSSEQALDCLRPRLATAAARCPATEAPLRGFGLFPERGAPRVLWVGLEFGPPLRELQETCETAAVACGFPRERRPYSPHLTLGRWRDRAPRPALPARDLGAARLSQLVLYRSELRPGGAVYTPLAIFPLGG